MFLHRIDEVSCQKMFYESKVLKQNTEVMDETSEVNDDDDDDDGDDDDEYNNNDDYILRPLLCIL